MDLCSKYDAHINIEVCSGISAVKYIYKYVYKGNDQILAKFNIHNTSWKNEIEHYNDCRYVQAIEACYRIFGFHMHAEHPAVQILPFHLLNEQNVWFQSNVNLADILRNPLPDTRFEAWFRLP